MGLENENRVRLEKAESLKTELMSEIAKYMEQKTDYRNFEVEKLLDEIKDRFIGIMQEYRINANEDYMESQLEVLKHGIRELNSKRDQDLFLAMLKNLNSYVENLEENDNGEKNEQQKVENEIEENKEKREVDASAKIIPSIESYICDIFSNTLKRTDIKITESTMDELKHIVFSTLKNAIVNETRILLEEENSEMFSEIQNKIDEFFSITEQKEEEKEDNDKKPWELTPEELAKINPDDAVKKATEKETDIGLPALPDNILE